MRGVFADHASIELPEIVDLSHARAGIASDAIYVEASELHRLDDRRILRYDLTLPLLLDVRYTGTPLRLFASRQGLSARPRSTPRTSRRSIRPRCCRSTARQPRSVAGHRPGAASRSKRCLPGPQRPHHAEPLRDVQPGLGARRRRDGRWFEVMAWGVFTDRVVEHLGGDPAVHTAIGVGYGLERLAMLRYGIDDIRKVEAARVAVTARRPRRRGLSPARR